MYIDTIYIVLLDVAKEMANFGIVLLISLVVLSMVVVTILLSWAAVESYNDHANVIPSCDQDIDIASLVQVKDRCIQSGVATSLYYIGSSNNSKYDFVVAPWKTQPLDVCVGFCTSYSSGVCNGPNSNGKSAQINFNHCMDQLSSTTCSPPIPIAADGAIIYYAYSPTCNICDNCKSE